MTLGPTDGHTVSFSHTWEQRILARVLTFPCMDFRKPLWDVMFSLVAMAILEKDGETCSYNFPTGISQSRVLPRRADPRAFTLNRSRQRETLSPTLVISGVATGRDCMWEALPGNLSCTQRDSVLGAAVVTQ